MMNNRSRPYTVTALNKYKQKTPTSIRAGVSDQLLYTNPYQHLCRYFLLKLKYGYTRRNKGIASEYNSIAIHISIFFRFPAFDSQSCDLPVIGCIPISL